MLGYPPETASALVQPFDLERFVDPQARASHFSNASESGAVTDYLLRLRRARRLGRLGRGDRGRRAP